jgi:predicted nucleic acid-binding protein
MDVDGAPPATALDTSVIVSGLLAWHQLHEIASAQLSVLLESQAEVVIPLHALVEAYAVMTRLPPPHRLSAKDAVEVLERSLRARSTLVGLEGDQGWHLIRELSRHSIAGGTSYDGLILACARKGGARRLLTFNRAHFERIGTEGIEILTPGSAGPVG